jgi:hypothetical protein
MKNFDSDFVYISECHVILLIKACIKWDIVKVGNLKEMEETTKY